MRKWGKAVSLGKELTEAIGPSESGLVQLLRNAYKRELKHQSEGPTFKHSKPMQDHFSISLILLQFQQRFYSDS